MPFYKRWWFWVLVAVGLPLGYWLFQVAIVARSAYRAGFFDKTSMANYQGDDEANLKAIHTALKMYMESEGGLPPAEIWMDVTWLRLKQGNMKEDEAKKKLIRPDLRGRADAYGYSFNPALSGHYLEDLKDQKTPVVYVSKDTAWNAQDSQPSGLAIAADGTILQPKN